MGNLGEIVFCAFHPVKAVITKMRQIGVGADMTAPPAGTTIEDFSRLPVSQAAALLFVSRSGVQLEDWPLQDQQRLKRGEKPRGVPTHRNL